MPEERLGGLSQEPSCFALQSWLPARLAWSVHAADDKLRKLLVPTTRHTMAELRDARGEKTPG